MLRTALLVLLLAVPTSANDLAGHWEGTGDASGSSVPVLLDLGPGSGTVGLPSYEVLGIPIEFELQTTGVQFDFESGGKRHTFKLEPEGDELRGIWCVEEPPVELTLSLKRVADSRPYTEEEITFHSDIKLAGTVFVPKSPGPHAGIALIHGSGDNERWWREYYADWFARQGLAVVFFDKRGNGDSEGDWNKVGFEPLARDGIAALEYLASREDIRKDALGFWGISQAGWIMPLAATLSDRVNFIIVTSGATVTVEEEGYYDYIVAMKDAGYSEADQQKMLEILKLDRQVTRTGEGYEELRALVEPVRKEMWWRQSGFIASPADFAGRDFYRLIVDFDPRPIIEQLDIPVLWLYGEADKSVETPRSVAILEDIMKQGDHDFTIKRFPDADHGLRVQAHNGIMPTRLSAPGYWDAIATWLAEKGLTKPRTE